ncbi:MAG: uncharacterized protein PWQ74_988 [Methanobacteriaceae archaeon]|nr:uncharacterized protein [Methanobacteriaceae archaeon]
MTIELIIFLFIVGILAGLLGSLIGTGGCALMLPILFFIVYKGDVNQLPIAIGTTLVAVIFTTTSGAYGHLRIRNVHKQTALWLGIGGTIGVILGSIIFSLLILYNYLVTFELILGLIFLWPAIRMIKEGVFSPPPMREGDQIGGEKWKKGVFGFLVGIAAGIAGLGGGYALVPGLIYLFEGPVYITMGTSLAAMIPLAVIGGLLKILGNYVNIPFAVSLGIGTSLGAQIGPRIIKKIKPNILKTIFGIVFFYISLKYILLYFGIHI